MEVKDHILPSHLNSLWKDYLERERVGIHSSVIEGLEHFIEQLLMEDPLLWKVWGLQIVTSVVEEGATIPIRFPLFQQVLFPLLVEGILRREARSARLLAHFDQFLHKVELSVLPETLQTSVGLLEEGLRIDPDDTIARGHLVEIHANYLRYTIHEIPSGVLYGDDGTTVEKCDDLLVLLQEFQAHVDILGEKEQYEELIRQCVFHYTTYREFLLQKNKYASYKEFLEECW